MELGDRLWPGFDKRNMFTVDNELYGLYSFIGTGIKTGWEIIPMPILPDTLPTPLTPDIENIINERTLLSTASVGTNLYFQYQQLGNPTVLNNENIWKQVFKVTPGEGIIGNYPAKTTDNYYFRIQQNGIFDVFAVPSPCLISEGLASITAPVPSQDNYLQTHTATPLGCVIYTGGLIIPSGVTMSASIGSTQFTTNVAYDFQQNDIVTPTGISTQARYLYANDSSSPYLVTSAFTGTIPLGTPFTINRNVVLSGIGCSDVRTDLNHLNGQFQKALQQALYRHVHLGGNNNPSKIQLSTHLILHATITMGSPIFYIYDSNNNLFTWNDGDYGVPIVYVNSRQLNSTEYNINSNLGKIYLKNSLSINSSITIILPLAPEFKLTVNTIIPNNSINSTPIILTGNFGGINSNIGRLISGVESNL
jgi:hypothetical protein